MNALPAVRLLAILDRTLLGDAELIAASARVSALAAKGTLALDLRDKSGGARELLALGRSLRELTREHGQHLVVSERLDLAVLLEADALHLGERALPSARARELWKRPVICACHEPERAGLIDAEIVLLSPIVEARKGNPALGREGLRRARAALEAAGSSARLFALGGVDAHSAASCLAAGAHGVAAIGAVFGPTDPARLLSALGILRGSSPP